MGRLVRARGIWLSLAVSLVLVGCANLFPPPFDPVVYQNDVQLKFETLALIDKSGEPYAAHQSEVQVLLVKYDAAAANAGKVESNLALAQAWQIIRGQQSGSAGEYFETWKKRGTLRPVIRNEKKAQITRHFDYVICLDAAKPGATATATCNNPLSAPAAPPNG